MSGCLGPVCGRSLPDNGRVCQTTGRDIGPRRTRDYRLARAAATTCARRPPASAGGLFVCAAPMAGPTRESRGPRHWRRETPDDGTRSSTPRCATVPSARASRTRSRTSSRSRACSTSSASAFIEGGWPGAMPKDTEFFAPRPHRAGPAATPILVAFGVDPQGRRRRPDATRRSGRCSTPRRRSVCLVAKSDVRHVERALRTTGEENLAMVRDTVDVSCGPRAGASSSTASTSSTASGSTRTTRAQVVGDRARGRRRGRRACATPTAACCRRGDSAVDRVGALRDRLLGRRRRAWSTLGIHCQNDTSCAVANTIAAVEAGVRHFQCTANGYGERPGNADLFAVVANLQLKLGLPVLPDGCLDQMVRVSHAIAEIANLAPDTHQAYVGAAAFAHKAGLHASAIKVDPVLYNHIDPAIVGNDMKILVTEMAGRASDRAQVARARARPGRPSGHADPGHRTRSRTWRPPAGRSRRPTRRSSCWCARSSGGVGRAVHARVLPGHRRTPRGRRGGLRGDGQGAGARASG